MIGCSECESSALGFCFSHLPPKKKEKIPPTYEELLSIVTQFNNHEGTKWLRVPCPHLVLGCNFCGNEYRTHDKECLVLKVEKLLNRTE